MLSTLWWPAVKHYRTLLPLPDLVFHCWRTFLYILIEMKERNHSHFMDLQQSPADTDCIMFSFTVLLSTCQFSAPWNFNEIVNNAVSISQLAACLKSQPADKRVLILIWLSQNGMKQLSYEKRAGALPQWTGAEKLSLVQTDIFTYLLFQFILK